LGIPFSETAFSDVVEILNIGGRVNVINNGQNIQLVNQAHNNYELYFNRIRDCLVARRLAYIYKILDHVSIHVSYFLFNISQSLPIETNI
jgi:hypothetical protein